MSTRRPRIEPHKHFKDEIYDARMVRPNRPPYKGVHAQDIVINDPLDYSDVMLRKILKIMLVEGLDGYFDASGSGGSITANKDILQLDVSGSGSAWMYSRSENTNPANDILLRVLAQKDSASIGTLWFGCRYGTNEFIRFEFTTGGKIQARLGGWTQELQSYIADTLYKLEARYYTNDRVEFYVNDILKATFEHFLLDVDGRIGGGGWGILVGSSPYLDVQDFPTNYIRNLGNGVTSKEYTLTDIYGGTHAPASAIHEVLLEINCWCSQIGGVSDSYFEIWNGSVWSSPYTIFFPYSQTSDYQEFDVHSFLDTKAKIDAAKIRITTGSYFTDYFVDHAYLKVKSNPTLPDHDLMDVDIYLTAAFTCQALIKFYNVITGWSI